MKILKAIGNYFAAFIGCAIYAMGISMFLAPAGMVSGGVSGIAIILAELTKISSGVWVVIMNIPIIIIGLLKLKKSIMINTVFGVLSSSGMMIVFDRIVEKYGVPTTDTMLCAITGGSLLAIGMGLILRFGATTGGTDIIIKILRKKYKSIHSGVMYFILDIAVIGTNFLIFGNFEKMIYTIAAIVIQTLLLDVVLYGSDSASLVYIISDKSDEISKVLLNDFSLGVTLLDGEGAYTEKNYRIIMCVCRRNGFSNLRRAVKDIDKDAFLIVTKAAEIFGNGFKSQYSEEI